MSLSIGGFNLLDAKTLLITTLLLAFTAPANADQQLAAQATPPERISFLVTFGEDKCPEAVGAEIVVCAATPERDRYRIPKDLRGNQEDFASGETSWTSAVESLDGYSRAILPNSCSVNGSNGFTGCSKSALDQWHAERRSKHDAK